MSNACCVLRGGRVTGFVSMCGEYTIATDHACLLNFKCFLSQEDYTLENTCMIARIKHENRMQNVLMVFILVVP